LLNPILRTGVMRLRRLCNEVAEWGLFAFEKNKTYDLEDFISAQNIRRVQVTTWLTEFAADVRALVRGACDEVLDGFLTANDIRADHKMTFMERAALRHECRKLTKFIRLADFLVKDTLLTMALESTNAVRNYVIPPSVSAALANAAANGDGAPNPFMMITAPSAVYVDLPPEGSAPGTLPPQNTKKEHHHGKDGAAAGGKAEDGNAKEKKEESGAAGKDKKKDQNLGPLFRVCVSLEAGPPEKPGSASGRSNGSGDPNEDGSLQHGSASEYHQENGNGNADGNSNGNQQNGNENHNDEVVDPSYTGLPTPILSLSPSVSQIKSALKSLLYDAMVVISAPPRLLSHPDLAPYTQAASDDGGGDGGGDDEEGDEETDLTEAATSHATYRRMASEMFTGIEAAYAAVHDFCRVFVPCSRTYFSNERDFATVAARFGLDSSLDSFSDAIEVYRGQVEAFEQLPSYADIGVIRLDSVSLKRMLIPSPTRCLLSIRDVLPMIMGQLTANLVNSARAMYNVLAGSPGDVDPFVAKIEMLEKVVEQMPGLRERESHIRSLAHIMGDNNWALADDLKAQFRVMKDTLAELDAASQKAEASQDEDIKRFAKQVEAAIPIMKKAVLAIREKMDDAMISNADSPPAKVVKFIREAAVKMDELKAQGAKFQHYQTALRQPVQTFETLDEVASDLAVKLKLWESLQEWQALTASWKQMPFEKIDAEEMNKQVGNYQKVASRSERALPGNLAAGKLRALVEDFKGLLPVVVDLRNRALQPRHWAEIEAALGTTIDPTKSYTLGELLDMNVVEHQPELSVIAVRATSELALEELFAKKVTSVWTSLEFIVNPYKDSKEVFILGSLEEIIAALDESLVTINTILGSRYCSHIRTDVEAYQKRLMLLSETLDEWLNCQKQWMYLEAILFADDIKRDLPDESKKFAAVDRSWKTIMKRTYNNPNALVSGTVKGLKETLVRHNEVLEAIQKSLEAYLEKKRSTFPRFYFLSNDELLEILAQARDPQAVQPHLRKCFDALTRLEFGKDPGSVDIHAMISPEGERVALPKNLNARGAVEYWLKAVQDGMMVALRGLMKEGFNDYQKKERKVWVLSHAGQVVATVAQIMWSYETEAALRHPTDPLGAVAAWYDKNVRQLADLTALVRSNLSKLERKVIVALVTTDVHARDIVEELMNSKTTSVGSFTWQQQLRYYWEDAKLDVAVRQSNALLYYGYEYQGATSRLVITPLTDRCWMTITGACNLKLGAAPAGPAGTGKTESSKDLAKALAIQCIVFNCSDQVDYQLLGKLFAGLAQSGSWTCLDEFNRIDIEVLSVVAQQLQQLRQGLVQGLAVMPFEGRTIVLRPHCGEFGRSSIHYHSQAHPSFISPLFLLLPSNCFLLQSSLR
jgi:dynein heavy chain, axonemal